MLQRAERPARNARNVGMSPKCSISQCTRGSMPSLDMHNFLANGCRDLLSTRAKLIQTVIFIVTVWGPILTATASLEYFLPLVASLASHID